MSTRPLVSVIMPCYNAAATVAASIAAARAQDYRPIEIIAVDDKSRDETIAVLQSVAGDDLTIIAAAQNGGAGATRNRAMAAAKGKYLAFLDSDDTWTSDKITRQIALLEADPAMVMAGCHAEVQRVAGGTEGVNRHRAPPQGQEAWRAMLHHSFYVPSEIVVRRSIAEQIGGFDETMRGAQEDQDFFIRAALCGGVGFVDACLVTMHEQPGSLSIRNRSREYETVLPMILHHCDILRDRLSAGERRAIIGARLGAIGRNVYFGRPALGAKLLLRAILAGDERLTNSWYLITASPWARWLKAKLRHSAAAAETLART
ncbi:MAG TPA: glycosyltransferase family A protein [Stellaceae bacterium]|nr:glycosyltransferase family A protein [Stellaceae bacterium]